MVQTAIEEIDGEGFAAYAVWEPILRTDDERSARKATTLFSDTRVTNYWVSSRDVGVLFQAPIDLTSEPAWDVYLVYGPDAIWGESAPEPEFFMHQLTCRLPDAQRLDGPRLAEGITRLLVE